MNGYDISSTFLVFVGSSFANAGGAGGGGIFVPLLILLTQFTPHGAIPLSKAMSTYTKKNDASTLAHAYTKTVFGGALTFVSITFRRRHPEVDRPLIDYDIALMLNRWFCAERRWVFYSIESFRLGCFSRASRFYSSRLCIVHLRKVSRSTERNQMRIADPLHRVWRDETLRNSYEVL